MEKQGISFHGSTFHKQQTKKCNIKFQVTKNKYHFFFGHSLLFLWLRKSKFWALKKNQKLIFQMLKKLYISIKKWTPKDVTRNLITETHER